MTALSRLSFRSLLLCALVLGVAACKRDAAADAAATDPAGETPPAAIVETPPAEAPVVLTDVIETGPRAVIGISYPKGLEAYPGLAKAVHDYAVAARGELDQALSGLQGAPTAPYELSLNFETVTQTPALVTVAADGSRYTGGAHGEPLVARFTWLTDTQELLTAPALVPTAVGWANIANYVRAQLRDSLARRAQAQDGTGDIASQLRSADKMIIDGTKPDPANYGQFVPVMEAGGKIAALRFIFAPYQVGPYSDGTQVVEVPAAVLLPNVAPAYQALFSTAPAPAPMPATVAPRAAVPTLVPGSQPMQAPSAPVPATPTVPTVPTTPNAPTMPATPASVDPANASPGAPSGNSARPTPAAHRDDAAEAAPAPPAN